MADPIQPLIAKDPYSARSRVIYRSGAWIFSVALALFLAALIVAGGLWIYARSLATAQNQWRDQIKTQEDELRPDLLAQLVDLSNSLNVARELLAKHVFVSNVFAFLQEAAHPKVQFTSFSFSLDSQKIDVSGLAPSYRAVAEQISALESSPQVEHVDFGGLSLADRGLVNFKLAIIVKTGLLALRAAEQ